MAKGKCPRCKRKLTAKIATPGIMKRGHGHCGECSCILQMKHRRENPKKWILTRARSRAQYKKAEFNLTLADIPNLPEYCPLFPWIKLRNPVGEGQIQVPEGYSVDRIDSSKGYIKGNIRIISFRANQLKNNGTIEEFEAILKDLKSRNF